MRLSVGHLLSVSRTGMKSFANQMFDRTGHEQIEHGRQNNFNLTLLHYGMFSYRYGWEGWVTSNNKGQLYDSTVASGNVLNCLLHG